MNTKISKSVAKELAICFCSAIPQFIEANKDAYLSYLIKTGQQSLDPYYSNQITETGNEQRKCS